MTLQLTPEMSQALEANPGQPLYIADATGASNYVLIPTSTFQKLQPLLYDAGEFDPDEFLPLVHEAMKEIWDAPGMELYDNYDAHRPTP